MRYKVDYQLLSTGVPIVADVIFWGDDNEVTARDRLTNKKTTYSSLADLYRAYPGAKLIHPTKQRLHLARKPLSVLHKHRIMHGEDRPSQVAALIHKGLSDKEIAESLYVTTSTVKDHVATLKKRLGVSTRVEIALWYERKNVNANRKD